MKEILLMMMDTNEPKPYRDWVRSQMPGVNIVEQDMEYADFRIATSDGKVLFIERKTPSDFLGSVASGRILSQVAGMTEISDWCYVVITGQIIQQKEGVSYSHNGRWIKRDWNFNSIQGAMLTIQDMGCRVLTTDDFIGSIGRLSRRSRKPVPVRKYRGAERLTVCEEILIGIPGIGVTKAKEVAGMFSQNAGVCLSALTDPKFPHKIKGITNKTKLKIRKHMGIEGGSMTVWADETE